MITSPQLLLDHGEEPNITDKRGRTALHVASFYGQFKVVELLLERGADIHTKDDCEYTALHEAAGAGRVEIFSLLLDRHADPNEQKDDGWAALHLALDRGHVQVVGVLLKGGADPLGPDQNQNVDTPFQLASRRKHMQIMRSLSERTGEKMGGSETQG